MRSFEEIIQGSLVCLDMTEKDGTQVITAMIEAAVREGVLDAAHKDAAIRAVLNRELSASTALPDGIAMPHGRTDCVSDLVCMLGIHPEGIDFGAPDQSRTHIFVLLLVPASAACNHIYFLTRLSRRLMEMSVRNELLAAKSRDDVMKALLN